MNLLPSLLLFVLHGIVTSAAATPPSSPYAPSFVKCPSNVEIRSAKDGLSSEETAWRKLRLKEVTSALPSYLENADIPDFNINTYLKKISASNAPIAGLAISGGGSQSGMGGLGIWQAFDSRYTPAVKAGTGGLLQCLSYLTGLSGGGFNTVLPLASNNFSSLAELRKDVDLTSDYLSGPDGNQKSFYKDLFEDAYSKLAKGFTVTVTDIFGGFFRQYLNKDWAYKSFSDVASSDGFSKGLTPMPLVLYTEVVPGSSPAIGKIMYPKISEATTYEVSPFEFGSWLGGRVQAFLPTKYLGTKMSSGKPSNKNKCAKGFDKVTFMQGSTGNAWNFWFIDLFYNIPLFYKRDVPVPSAAKKDPEVGLVEAVASTFKQSFNDSLWATYPNPFNNYSQDMKNVAELLLVDGSENSETIPLRSLVIPERKVDFIVAFDSGGDEPGNNWVNGTTFGQSAKNSKALGIPFPNVPDAATFINLGLNQYPTFFGCGDSSSTPLILYMPNSPWSAYSNYSYTTSQFTNNQLDLVFENSLNIASYGQGKLTKNDAPPFPACVACGLIYKSLMRTNQNLPSACQSCFKAHCWNGTVADTPSNPPYEPELVLDPGVSYQKWNKTVWSK